MAAIGVKLPTMLVFKTEDDVSLNLCNFIIDKANKQIEKNNKFIIGLSGGSLSKLFCKNVTSQKTDWTKWKIFMCDERYVPQDDVDCSYKYYKENLIPKIPQLQHGFFPINVDLEIDECAEDYAQKIRTACGGNKNSIPKLDMLLLGMGPDGHTCSLFSGHKLLEEQHKIVASIIDSPKPPPKRVTMTLPLINNAACVIFALCGANKTETLQKIFRKVHIGEVLPASLVKPVKGELVWFLDTEASARLQPQ